MSRGLDQFESSVRQSLEGVKFDYEPQGWAEMEARLNRAGGSARRTNSLWAAAGFLVLSAGAFTLLPGHSSTASLAGRSADVTIADYGYTTASSGLNATSIQGSSADNNAATPLTTSASSEGSITPSSPAENAAGASQKPRRYNFKWCEHRCNRRL